jgi:hypothetical protein
MFKCGCCFKSPSEHSATTDNTRLITSRYFYVCLSCIFRHFVYSHHYFEITKIYTLSSKTWQLKCGRSVICILSRSSRKHPDFISFISHNKLWLCAPAWWDGRENCVKPKKWRTYPNIACNFAIMNTIKMSKKSQLHVDLIFIFVSSVTDIMYIIYCRRLGLAGCFHYSVRTLSEYIKFDKKIYELQYDDEATSSYMYTSRRVMHSSGNRCGSKTAVLISTLYPRLNTQCTIFVINYNKNVCAFTYSHRLFSAVCV